jgi:hypothetical protein
MQVGLADDEAMTSISARLLPKLLRMISADKPGDSAYQLNWSAIQNWFGLARQT